MDDNAEDGIARTQATAARLRGASGLGQYHNETVAYLDDRIIVFLVAIAMVGLMTLWATTTSPWLLYGSLVVLIALVFWWGFARIRRIERLREARAQEARDWRSSEPG